MNHLQHKHPNNIAYLENSYYATVWNIAGSLGNFVKTASILIDLDVGANVFRRQLCKTTKHIYT